MIGRLVGRLVSLYFLVGFAVTGAGVAAVPNYAVSSSVGLLIGRCVNFVCRCIFFAVGIVTAAATVAVSN